MLISTMDLNNYVPMWHKLPTQGLSLYCVIRKIDIEKLFEP